MDVELIVRCDKDRLSNDVYIEKLKFVTLFTEMMPVMSVHTLNRHC